MPLQETSGAASYDAFGGGVAVIPNYIEEVFSTYLYTGNGSTQTITNGIDLSTKGGLVWMKGRSGATDHALYDTVRGVTKDLASNTSDAETTQATGLTSFATTGFSIGALAKLNTSSATYVSWTFREQPKFFDVVTYTGTGSNRTIAHNLGSVPGCIIVKNVTSTFTNWQVYHRSLASPTTQYGVLNSYIGTPTNSSTIWNSTAPTSTVFSLGTDATVNASGGTYVAYVFAHDAGGFGLTGTDNVISCGSFTTDGSGNATVNLGYEPQWVLIKDLDNQQYYAIYDTMRGLNVSVSNSRQLFASTADAEGQNPVLSISANGFGINQYTSTNYIYIAIRRGPMKVPTDGTKVFAPATRTGTGTTATVTSTISPIDMLFSTNTDRVASSVNSFWDRLRGGGLYLNSTSTDAQASNSSVSGFDVQNGVTMQGGLITNGNSYPYVNYNFQRAPGFFDEVCYTGTGSGQTVNHNLGAVPELMIVKRREGPSDWFTYIGTNTSGVYLNTTGTPITSTAFWNNTSPTSSVFTVGGSTGTVGYTYVAYLFATCPGVSKVGSYTGTGTTLQINCGFAAGARFVLIKRTDSTGDWYVWDSARGIVAGNDPYLLLNSTAAEVTGTDYVDTYSAGFEISSTAPAAINANGGTFIFLAIA